MRKTKNLRATMSEDAVTVELEEVSRSEFSVTIAVYLDGALIGYLASFPTQSERAAGHRLVTRGKEFEAWAQRGANDDRFDYYMQHRSQSAAIRRLLSEAR